MKQLVFKQRRSSPDQTDLWEKKQAVRQLDGVSVFKKGNDYFFAVDPDEADMDDVREAIKDTVTEEDYIKHFIQKCPLPRFLGEIEQKLNFSDFLPEYEISADIANITELSAYKTVFEVTMSESGQNRLRCMISTAAAKEHHLRGGYPGNNEWVLDAVCPYGAIGIPGEENTGTRRRGHCVSGIPLSQ